MFARIFTGTHSEPIFFVSVDATPLGATLIAEVFRGARKNLKVKIRPVQKNMTLFYLQNTYVHTYTDHHNGRGADWILRHRKTAGQELQGGVLHARGFLGADAPDTAAL